MKLRKGNKVEVWRRTTGQIDSWFPGKIISVHGDEYIVKYELLLTLEGEAVVEKVNQEDVRPQPPPTNRDGKWMLGDLVEVFDSHCWRVGKIVKVLGRNRFVIRLSDCIQLKEFHQSSLRVRQAWQNYKWVLIGKVSGCDEKFWNSFMHDSSKYPLGLVMESPQQGIQREIHYTEKEGQEHRKTSHHVRTLQRNCSCQFDGAVVELDSKRRKMATNEGGCDIQLMRTLPFSKQVDTVSCTEANEGKSCTLGYSGKRARTEKTINCSIFPFSMPAQIAEDSDGCSVASCSSNDFPDYMVRTARKSNKDITESSCDDAESLCPSASWREYLPSEDALEVNIRELELHAYRRTLQALYASGPLSWEQESLLTNLRISLHISNEEHLLLLKQLLSDQDS
ncbi:Plant tudor-like rna-binding protein [Thalictrum thalictroides]|uniref:Plant tudor-like rna-binding protein n=1 Tax=Thalictrum thalictroides TaxID=46969 RepID=A0A7J6XCX1_THATH|nr:Plant tudor-like rna-binding protein [Thalictrum thalictroides]